MRIVLSPDLNWNMDTAEPIADEHWLRCGPVGMPSRRIMERTLWNPDQSGANTSVRSVPG